MTGSSPLTRGKRPTRKPRPPIRGLIPAHAGKTRRHNYHQGSRWAHPRSRGENATRASAPSHEAGSSPLTRGKPAAVVMSRDWPGSPRPQLPRLIPAHAGKTVQQRRGGKFGGAHPRSRGENESAGDARHNHGRLIPAHAGKTAPRSYAVPHTTAHPRSRGENTADDALTQQPAGSSPLTRGKPGA